MVRSILLSGLAAVTATHAIAQDESAAAPESGDAILVLDASGSMWGQIDGEPKIVIARDVISELLDSLPAERRLGLVAYGHNRKGDCGDIETLAGIGAEREAIRAAVQSLNPKGKTPLSAAVEKAAGDLKFTEDKATVILVSDGEETCDADPCSVAEALEKTGVDFTAHVVGFDLGSAGAEAEQQLRCLAENTGGRFMTAANAEELTEALEEVSAAAPEPPANVKVQLQATDQDGGPVITEGLLWTVTHGASGDVLFESEQTGRVEAEIPKGIHDVRVERVSDGAGATGEINAGPNGGAATLPIIVAVEATLDAPETAPAGSDVRVTWTGPDEDNDYISVAGADADDDEYDGYTRTRQGNPLAVTLPDEPGEYELRYVLDKNRDVLARAAITAEPVEATISAPETADAGATVQVEWTGPDYNNDYITVAKPDAEDREYENYTRTRQGNPLEVKLPDEPGDYEIRYVVDQSDTVLARQAISTRGVEAAINVPETAPAGSALEVEWTGPDYDNDYITVAQPDAEDRHYENYTRTRQGNPLSLRLPDTPGEYEIRYVLDQSNTVLARAAIQTTAVEATLSFPDTAPAGSDLEVEWTGPDYNNDYLTVARPDAEDRNYESYTRTRQGNPLAVKLPDEPGEYEIRYILDQSNTALARGTVRTTPVDGTVTAPESAPAGGEIEVEWTGPDYNNDYITIARPDAEGRHYESYTRTRRGSPLMLDMPDEPGEYEIRYILDQSKTILARTAITVSEAEE